MSRWIREAVVGAHADTARAIVFGAAIAFSGCAASISSRSYEHRTGEGIIYKLPMREYVTTVTYELAACNPAKVGVVEFAVSSSLIPSDAESDWFEIDIRQLKKFISSVDPATIEMNRGMLTSVGLKTSGALPQVLAMAKELKAFAASAVGEMACSAGAQKAIELRDKAVNSLAKSQAELVKDEEAFRQSPTKENERRVKWTDARVSQSKATLSAIRESRLRKSVIFRLVPRPTDTQQKYCESPKPEAVADWITNGADAHAALERTFRVCLGVESIHKVGTPVNRPSDDTPYPGVYYRRPGSARVTFDVATEGGQWVYRSLTAAEIIPQLGTLQRVELKGSAIGSRNVSVAFDENGEIKKYEVTSKGMAEALQASLKEAGAATTGTPEPSELEKLTADVALLQKKKELIEAKAALEAAETVNAEP